MSFCLSLIVFIFIRLESNLVENTEHIEANVEHLITTFLSGHFISMVNTVVLLRSP